MTNEELDRARIDEACRLVNDDKTKLLLGEVARLAREGWTPPKVVDPDLVEAEYMYKYGPNNEIAAILAGIKRGRELERAVMGNPIPEQIQEVTPPVAVDPDLAETYQFLGWNDEQGAILAALKHGREIERAEAEPGMVWVKHDRSRECPVDMKHLVLIAGYNSIILKHPATVDWDQVSLYAEAIPPEEK